MDHVAIELIRLALHPDDVRVATSAATRMESLRDREWRGLLEQLRAHRLIPLVYYSLRAHGLDAKVPQPFRRELLEEHDRALAKNSREPSRWILC